MHYRLICINTIIIYKTVCKINIIYVGAWCIYNHALLYLEVIGIYFEPNFPIAQFVSEQKMWGGHWSWETKM